MSREENIANLDLVLGGYRVNRRFERNRRGKRALHLVAGFYRGRKGGIESIAPRARIFADRTPRLETLQTRSVKQQPYPFLKSLVGQEDLLADYDSTMGSPCWRWSNGDLILFGRKGYNRKNYLSVGFYRKRMRSLDFHLDPVMCWDMFSGEIISLETGKQTFFRGRINFARRLLPREIWKREIRRYLFDIS